MRDAVQKSLRISICAAIYRNLRVVTVAGGDSTGSPSKKAGGFLGSII